MSKKELEKIIENKIVDDFWIVCIIAMNFIQT